MAIVGMDGLDHLQMDQASGQIGRKLWVTDAGGSAADWGETYGRFGGGGQYLTNRILSGYAPFSGATALIGFAYKTGASFTNGNNILKMFNATGATEQWTLQVSGSGNLIATRWFNNTLATSTNTLSTNTWYHIGVKVLTADGTSGTFEVQVNGSNSGWINASSLDTKNATDATVGYFSFGGSGGDTYLDDVYCADSGSLLGDVRIVTLYPSADGYHTDWSLGSGSVHSALVDDPTSTDDTDDNYIYTSTLNEIDTFEFQDLPAGTIHATQLCITARKTDAVSRGIKHVYRISSSDYLGSTERLLGTTYTAPSEIRETSPATSVAWTQSEINGAQFGVKLTT